MFSVLWQRGHKCCIPALTSGSSKGSAPSSKTDLHVRETITLPPQPDIFLYTYMYMAMGFVCPSLIDES